MVQIGETALSTKKPLTADATYTVTTAYASSPAAQQGAILDVAGNCLSRPDHSIQPNYSFRPDYSIAPNHSIRPKCSIRLTVR